jgi:hypothetical protein
VDTQTAAAAASQADERGTVVPSALLIAALSLANAIGFLPSTVMPVWVDHLDPPPGWPTWYGGALASLQLAVLTLGNLAAPRMTAAIPPRRSGPIVAPAVAVGFFLMSMREPAAQILGASISGLSCGCLLATANSIAACLPRPQHAFATLQIALVALGVALFFSLPRLLAAHGVGMIFIVLGIAATLATPAFRLLPETPARRVDEAKRTAAGSDSALRPLAILLGLGVLLTSQTALTACLLPAGTRIGLTLPGIGTALSVAAALCLLAPVAARALGERVGTLTPLIAGVLALAATAVLVMQAPTAVLFCALAAALMGLPVFILPYVLALLAGFGGGGRWSAIGPGFMMAGAALGPATAEILRAHLTLEALGLTMALPISVVAATFALCARRPRTGPDSQA